MALIRGKEVKESPDQEPANPRLWNMITMQAKTKFPKYPSPAAAHWVHAHYLQMGGQFVKSKKDVDPKMRDVAQEKMDAEDAARKKKVTKDIGINLINNEHFKR
jgi:hypothetical protein